MLPFRLVHHRFHEAVPLRLYTIGLHTQPYMDRPNGYSSDQVFVTKKGRGVFRFYDGREAILGPGQSVLVHEGVAHEYYGISEEPWDLAFVCFHASFSVKEHFGLPGESVCKLSSTVRVWQLIEELWEGAGRDDGLWSGSELLYSFLTEIRKQSSAGKGQEPVRIPQIRLLQRVVGFLHEHFTQSLRIRDIARSFGYTSQHLNRLFQEEYGLTAHQYVQSLQMKHAVFLLEEHPDWTVQEIAKRVGLETGYLIRQFKKAYGITPKRYMTDRGLHE